MTQRLGVQVTAMPQTQPQLSAESLGTTRYQMGVAAQVQAGTMFQPSPPQNQQLMEINALQDMMLATVEKALSPVRDKMRMWEERWVE